VITIGRLLRLKPKSQYQAASISAADAAKSIDWATRMLDVAKVLVRS
jgi:hypothetical protein